MTEQRGRKIGQLAERDADQPFWIRVSARGAELSVQGCLQACHACNRGCRCIHRQQAICDREARAPEDLVNTASGGDAAIDDEVVDVLRMAAAEQDQKSQSKNKRRPDDARDDVALQRCPDDAVDVHESRGAGLMVMTPFVCGPVGCSSESVRIRAY